MSGIFKDPVYEVGTSQTFSEFNYLSADQKVHWLMLKQQGRGVLTHTVTHTMTCCWERARPEVRGAHYAGRSPRGAPINSERASI